jgi:hypothetical protein
MQGAMDNMLTLAEEVVALSAKKKSDFPILDIFEIPEDQRDPNAPRRFKWAMKKQAS